MIPWELELEPAEVRRRIDWARRQGHPLYFWPEVEPGTWREATRVLEGVAASVLDGRAATLSPEDRLTARALGVAGYTSGLGPLVGLWIEKGRLEADPLLAELFSVHLDHGRRRARRLRQALTRAATALAGVEIEPLVVKSSHTAVDYFPEPGARPAIDVDLVVAPEEFAPAERALIDAGYSLGAREFRPRKTTWLAPGSARLPRSLEVVHADSQYAIDLHQSLERNFFGVRTVAAGEPGRASGVSAPDLGPAVRALEQPELLLYQALHASEGLYNLTLLRVVELAFIIRQDVRAGQLEWNEFRRLATERGAWRFVFPALSLVERLAPGTMDPETLARAERAAPARMARVVRGVSPAEAQRLRGRSLDETFMWCSSPMDYVRRAAHMLFPAPAGRSPRRLIRYYVERAYRVLRNTVSVRRSGGPVS